MIDRPSHPSSPDLGLLPLVLLPAASFNQVDMYGVQTEP